MTQATDTEGAASPSLPAEEPPESARLTGHPLRGGENAAGRAALALHMTIPGTRIDMVLGGPNPFLLELVRAMARAAAQADHGAELIGMIVGPTPETQD